MSSKAESSKPKIQQLARDKILAIESKSIATSATIVLMVGSVSRQAILNPARKIIRQLGMNLWNERSSMIQQCLTF
jgi:hypothetical protein